MSSKVPGRVLLIAGSDSSGGAGLEAGQKVLAAHGCYAMTATTALTAQNTMGVKRMHVIPADVVGVQVQACLEDIGADVVATGMLASEEIIRVIAEQLVKHKVSQVIVDPVMVATSGAELLPLPAVQGLIQHILPITTLLTPNMEEAMLLLSGRKEVSTLLSGGEIRALEDIELMGRELQKMGPAWVLIKGGHLPFRTDMTVAHSKADRQVIVDTLFGPNGFCLSIKSPWQETSSTHGTGCSLAAISSGIARGLGMPSSVKAACRYVEAGIRTASKLGKGNGPLGHFHSISCSPFSPGYFMEYLLERPDVKRLWANFVHHPFVLAIGDGTLPVESFRGYIVQVYLYLTQYARANALAGYKAKKMDRITASHKIVEDIAREAYLHVEYCESLGVSLAELQVAEELQACEAYSRYVLDIGQSEDWLALQMALAPCLLRYGAIAEALLADGRTRRDGNRYWRWIMHYTSESHVRAVHTGSQALEDHVRSQSATRVEELVKIFVHALRMEIGFWEMFPYK